MPVLGEILVYLLLILSIMFVTWLYIAYDNKNFMPRYNINNKYMRRKDKDIKVRIQVNIEGANQNEAEIIGKIIAYGKFNNIYDVADKYVVLMRQKEDKC